MSFLGRGRRRRGRRAGVFTFAGTLMVFQALAIIGAVPAWAVNTCSFAGSTVSYTINDPTSGIAQDSAGHIEFWDGAAWVDCSTATTTNTTLIQSAVSTGAVDELFEIRMYVNDSTTTLASWGAINWTIALGGNTAGGDLLDIFHDPVTSGGTKVTVGGSGIDLNGDGDLDVAYSGVESFALTGTTVDDTLSFGGGGPTGAALTGTTSTTITGNAGNDTLTGSDAADTLSGSAGDDTLDGGKGGDTLNGGTDAPTNPVGDTVTYANRTAAVTVTIGAGGANDGEFGEFDNVGGDVENVIGGLGADSLTGDADANSLTGGGGNDVLDGAAGDDTLTGGANDDTLTGAAGSDTADYSDATAGVKVDLSLTTQQDTVGGGKDTLSGIENLTGSSFDDTLTGDSGANTINGGDGADTIAGGTGADTEKGGDGNDTFDQGSATNGGDAINGEGGIDWVNYSARTSGVTVTLNTAGTDDGQSAEGDDVDGVENAALGTGDDTFTGDGFNNLVQPGGGQNVLDGGAGGDTLDYSVGYDAGVQIDLGGGGGTDAISNFENVTGTALADSITGSAGNNIIKAARGNDRVRAGGGDDTVRAGRGNDTVRGGSGDDDLFGGPGNDALSGGSGDDFCKGGKGKDTVKGCESGHA